MKRFTRLNVDDYDLTRVQDAVNEVLEPLQNVPFLDGVLLENISLQTGTNNIAHKLGKAWRMWVIMRKNASCDIYEGAQSLNNKFITLQSTGPVIVSIWVA